MRYCAITILVMLLVGLVSQTQAEDKDKILNQKSELERLQQDVAEGQRRLDSLQSAQRDVQGKISEYDQKISSDRQVIRRLNSQLDKVKRDIAVGDSVLTHRRHLYDRRHRRYLGNIRHFYMAAQSPDRAIAADPNDELDLQRQVVYLTALSGYESAGIADASELLDESLTELDEMSGRRKMIRGLKKERETSFSLDKSQKERQEKSLEQLRRKSMVEADRVLMLKQAAEEMAAIIARLEEQRTRDDLEGTPIIGESVFAGMKGHLTSPYRGKVIEGFGHHVDDVTNLKSFAPGITIQGKAGRSVYAVASGKVAYAGSLRGYGNFVIINHDRQYYTTYAGFGEILVSENQFLQARDKLGTSAADGIIKFEIRKGREPLDPVTWIAIESL